MLVSCPNCSQQVTVPTEATADRSKKKVSAPPMENVVSRRPIQQRSRAMSVSSAPWMKEAVILAVILLSLGAYFWHRHTGIVSRRSALLRQADAAEATLVENIDASIESLRVASEMAATNGFRDLQAKFDSRRKELELEREARERKKQEEIRSLLATLKEHADEYIGEPDTEEQYQNAALFVKDYHGELAIESTGARLAIAAEYEKKAMRARTALEGAKQAWGTLASHYQSALRLYGVWQSHEAKITKARDSQKISTKLLSLDANAYIKLLRQIDTLDRLVREKWSDLRRTPEVFKPDYRAILNPESKVDPWRAIDWEAVLPDVSPNALQIKLPDDWRKDLPPQVAAHLYIERQRMQSSGSTSRQNTGFGDVTWDDVAHFNEYYKNSVLAAPGAMGQYQQMYENSHLAAPGRMGQYQDMYRNSHLAPPGNPNRTSGAVAPAQDIGGH